MTVQRAAPAGREYRLIGPDGKSQMSPTPGTLGGHRPTKVYGRLECRTARQAIDRGGYVSHRVFFADKETAEAAGYRPCHDCMPDEYAARKGATGPAR